MSEQTRKVPSNAFRFDADVECHLQFAEGVAPAAGQPPRAKITMLARSGEPITHWYWGRIVHDMTGMRLRKETAPVDWCHDYDQLLGVLTEFKASNKGLVVSGELIAFQADDRAAEVIFKGQAGIPYEASLDWSGAARIEEVGEGITVQVNGKKFVGPGYVVREWPLRAVAVCPYGADPNTKSQFAAEEAAELDVTIFNEGAEMKTNTTAAGGTPAAQQTETAANPAPTAPPPAATQHAATTAAAATEVPTDGRAQFAAELKKFTDRFGVENGTKWFGDGKSFAESLELHTEALQQQLVAKDATITEQQTKLAAFPKGEKSPVSFNDAEKPGSTQAAPSKFANLGDNLSKVAEGMKFRGR